jgi:hypothetical protein
VNSRQEVLKSLRESLGGIRGASAKLFENQKPEAYLNPHSWNAAQPLNKKMCETIEESNPTLPWVSA